MSDPVVDKIQNHPKYKELRAKRNGFGWFLAVLMLVVYYGYVALIAFNKPFLAQPIGAGVTTIAVSLPAACTLRPLCVEYLATKTFQCLGDS